MKVKKLLSIFVSLSAVCSILTVPAKAGTNVLYESDLNNVEATNVTEINPTTTGNDYSWYTYGGADLVATNKALSPMGVNNTAIWEVPADFDPSKDWTLDCTWGKWTESGGCEFMIFTKADGPANADNLGYYRLLSSAGNNTYTFQIKYENGEIKYKRSTDQTSFDPDEDNVSSKNPTQQIVAIGLRKTKSGTAYLDDIVLKQGSKTWTENFDGDHPGISEYTKEKYKVSDYFKPVAFLYERKNGVDNKAFNIPKGSGSGGWVYFDIPDIKSGVYEFSADYIFGNVDNNFIYLRRAEGTYQLQNGSNPLGLQGSDIGYESRLTITIDKDNNKATTSWTAADGTVRSAVYDNISDTITRIEFRMHNTGTRDAWLDNVRYTKTTADAAPVTATSEVYDDNGDGTYSVGMKFTELNPSDYKYIAFKAGDEVKGGTVESVLGNIDGPTIIAVILQNAPANTVQSMLTNADIGIE